MRLAYLYNEILPTRKAHDAYVWRNCASLAEAGDEVVLACGRGTLPGDELARHYDTPLPASLRVTRLAILRRNLGLPFTWNRIFDLAAQRHLARERPDAVLLSVRKQGGFHLARKIAGIRYAYEVHELAWYPTMGRHEAHTDAISAERDMLSRADLVTVTTRSLLDILRAPPYSLSNAVEIVPLAISPPAAAPAIVHGTPLHLMYIGQLYGGQGVEDLVVAALGLEDVRLTIVGGTDADVARLRALVPEAASKRIAFTGFLPPTQLPALAAGAHGFVAPFRAQRRMPYVAHTKLAEYIAFRRPVIAPDLPIVMEHFPGGHGVATYRANDVAGLAQAMRGLLDPLRWSALAEAIRHVPVHDWRQRGEDYRAILRRMVNP